MIYIAKIRISRGIERCFKKYLTLPNEALKQRKVVRYVLVGNLCEQYKFWIVINAVS
jgi:hypothetical protein